MGGLAERAAATLCHASRRVAQGDETIPNGEANALRQANSSLWNGLLFQEMKQPVEKVLDKLIIKEEILHHPA